MSMIPTPEMRSKLVHMHARDGNGNLTTREHLLRQPLMIDPGDKAAEDNLFNSGGAGLFAKPQEYCSMSLYPLSLILITCQDTFEPGWHDANV